jgi:hypothetical protein
MAVKEAPSGAAPTPYYLDGIKYLELASNEEFNAAIEAFSAPKEFGICDGTASVYAGLFITQQPRKPFNLSYRTLIGNDVSDLGFAYKIHLIYNALAQPSAQDDNSISDSPNPAIFSWNITTVPSYFTGFKPSAHLVIDSRTAGPDVMTALEAFLYGTDSIAPAFPTPAQLLAIFDNFGYFLVKDLGGGRWSAEGEPVQIATNPLLSFTIDDPSVTISGDEFTITY